MVKSFDVEHSNLNLPANGNVESNHLFNPQVSTTILFILFYCPSPSLLPSVPHPSRPVSFIVTGGSLHSMADTLCSLRRGGNIANLTSPRYFFHRTITAYLGFVKAVDELCNRGFVAANGTLRPPWGSFASLWVQIQTEEGSKIPPSPLFRHHNLLGRPLYSCRSAIKETPINCLLVSGRSSAKQIQPDWCRDVHIVQPSKIIVSRANTLYQDESPILYSIRPCNGRYPSAFLGIVAGPLVPEMVAIQLVGTRVSPSQPSILNFLWLHDYSPAIIF